MKIQGKKVRSLLFKNITIALLVFSPFFLSAAWLISSGNVNTKIFILMTTAFIVIFYILINDYLEFKKAPDTIIFDLENGTVTRDNKVGSSVLKGMYFVGFGDNTTAYRPLLVRFDGSESFLTRHHIFDKNLGEIRDFSSQSKQVDVRVLNGFHLVNRRLIKGGT